MRKWEFHKERKIRHRKHCKHQDFFTKRKRERCDSKIVISFLNDKLFPIPVKTEIQTFLTYLTEFSLCNLYQYVPNKAGM